MNDEPKQEETGLQNLPAASDPVDAPGEANAVNQISPVEDDLSGFADLIHEAKR